jgi:hypothetical protein
VHTSNQLGWEEYFDFGTPFLCRAAGNAGEILGLWKTDEWTCVDSTLWVNDSSSSE